MTKISTLYGLSKIDLPASQFAFRDWVVTVLAEVWGYSYEQAIGEITARYNWNRGIFKCGIFQTSDDCMQTAECEKIVNAYMNKVILRKIPQLNRANVTKSTVNGRAEWQKIIDGIYDTTNRPKLRIELVLRNLYWGTGDGKIADNMLAFPLKHETESKNQLTPEQMKEKSGMYKMETGLGTYIKYFKYGLGIAGVGVLAYGVSSVARLKG